MSGFKLLGEGEHSAEVYQLGTGKNYSINELAKMFSQDIEYIPPRPGEARNTLADYSEMNQKTGWKPKIDIEKYVQNFLNNN